MTITPPRYWKPPAQLFRWTHCIVHHTAAKDDPRSMQADQIIDYHVRVKHWRDAGYHFLFEMIDGIPVAIFLRPLTLNGSHARGWNHFAVGTVFAGNFELTFPPAELISMAVEDVYRPIIRGLLNITPDHIYRHDMVGQTACPGSNLLLTSITDQL